jgi:subtilisin family serine protease
MAIIDGREPQAEPVRARVRVVVKLAERAMRGRSGDRPQDARDSALAELRRAVPEAQFKPYFEEEKEVRAAAQPPFNRYVAVEAPDRETAAELARKLQAQDLVEEAYVEGGPVPPPVTPIDDPRSANQGYLDGAPDGIDARWAWPVTDGSGIGFVDLERGWTLNHQDLAGASITLISGVNQDFHGHGTSVLGEVSAVDNMIGGIGIAPAATCRVVSQWRTSTNYNTAAAILSAGQAMSRGDVLLLEAQTTLGSQSNLPIEVETAVFDAIRQVIDDGIVVVEAAGNGGHDLDAFVNGANRHVLDRNSVDFRDSGAIMVGAASSSVPHARLTFSCHGSRVDCYGWGENIDTTGDGWQGNLSDTYTAGFGGTSGASPIVAGAAVLLQSWRRKRPKVYSPDTVRDLLSSNRNIASANPASDRIGVMPNLRAIIEAEIESDKWRPIRENNLQLVYILIGLIDDAPGVVWVPGKGPVPVDPDWLPISRTIVAAKRDLIAALAVSEITRTIEDQATRTRLNEAAVDAMHAAVDRIGQLR